MMWLVTMMWLADDLTHVIGRNIDDVASDLTLLLWPGMASILAIDSSSGGR